MKYLRRLQLRHVPGTFKNPIRGQVRGPEQLCSVFRDMKDDAKETLLGVYLDQNLELNSYEVLTIGSESLTFVVPDEVFRGAILTKSKYFVLVHNHPSGDPTPSDDDREVMRILVEQSKIMHRVFLDFLIIGDERHWSMFEEADGGEYALGTMF